MSKIVIDPTTGEVTTYSDEAYAAKRDALLLDWQAKKSALDLAKEAEIEARKQAVAFMHDPQLSGTTENVELGGGYKAKMKVPVRYGFLQSSDGKTDKAAIESALSRIESTGSAGELIASRIVKWNPELSLTEYKQLSPEFKTIIDSVIVTSEGTPTLEIVEPKAKK